MQGCGNDYVYVNCMDKLIDNPEKVSQYISDRHFGIVQMDLYLYVRLM